MTDRQTSGFENGKIMSEMESRPKSVSSRASFEAEKNSDCKEVRLRKLMQLLTSDIPGLAKDVINDLDDDHRNKKITKTLASENNELKRENEGLLQQIQELELKVSPTNQAKKHRVDQLEKQVAHEERKRAEAEKKIQEEKTTNAELLQSYKDELHTSQREIEQQKMKILRQEQDIARYKSRNEYCDRIENELQRTKETLKKKDDELEDYRTRLSRQMGEKLTDNNPNVADLSDRNRPTKIAEQYQEIYDNEWSDAYEKLDSTKGSEEKTIATLIGILQDTRSFCDKEAKRQMEEIQKTLTLKSELGSGNIPTTVKKQLKDCRKILAECSGKQISERYLKTLNSSGSPTAEKARLVQKFTEACLKICWLMAVQDPPVVFGPYSKCGVDFDTDVYKAYTESGRKILFIVWPALHLHEDGALLCKGIAQGKKQQRPVSALPEDRNKKALSDTRPSSAGSAQHVRESNDERDIMDQTTKQVHMPDSYYSGNTFHIDDYTSARGNMSHDQGYDRGACSSKTIPRYIPSASETCASDLSGYEVHRLGYVSSSPGFDLDVKLQETVTTESGNRDCKSHNRHLGTTATTYGTRPGPSHETSHTTNNETNYETSYGISHRSSHGTSRGTNYGTNYGTISGLNYGNSRGTNNETSSGISNGTAWRHKYGLYYGTNYGTSYGTSARDYQSDTRNYEPPTHQSGIPYEQKVRRQRTYSTNRENNQNRPIWR